MVSSNQNLTIFLAGASGAIGRRLSPMLVADGWQVIGSTRSSERAAMLRDLGVEPVAVDVFDAASLQDALSDVRPAVVIHQLTDLPPALDPGQMPSAVIRNGRIRDEGTRNLVAAAEAAGAGRLVAQSIAFAYAPGPLPYREEAPLKLDDPQSGPTARAVASLEAQVLGASMPGVVLRYGRLYGPGTGFDGPSAAGTPLHVDAAAHAARLAASGGEAGIYNVAEDDGTVSSDKAASLGWAADFRSARAHR